MSYRATHGIDHASVSMAVVVQEMIASEVSGVSFTANPVSGSRDEVIIESSWGMGAAIVDGRVTPDNYVLERADLRVRSQRIADKRLMVAAHLEAGQSARLEEVPNAMRRRESLTPDLLRTVVQWSLKCEVHFGKPQDVETADSIEPNVGTLQVAQVAKDGGALTIRTYAADGAVERGVRQHQRRGGGRDRQHIGVIDQIAGNDDGLDRGLVVPPFGEQRTNGAIDQP